MGWMQREKSSVAAGAARTAGQGLHVVEFQAEVYVPAEHGRAAPPVGQ
jgi:hypothetical protein